MHKIWCHNNDDDDVEMNHKYANYSYQVCLFLVFYLLLSDKFECYDHVVKQLKQQKNV